VTIFASGFSHVTQREERLRGRQLYRRERFEGVEFVWLRTFPYAGNTWRRQVNMLSYVAIFLVVQTRFAAPDAVIGSTVHPFAALGAWVVARLRKARFLFEIRDLWPQTLVDLGTMRTGSPSERILRSIEAFLVKHASSVITLLPGMADYLQERGLRGDHVSYIPNGVDLERFDAAVVHSDPPLDRVIDAISRLHAESRFVLGYVGAFGRVNRADIVVAAATIAEERAPGRIGLVLVGDGPERAAIARLDRPDSVALLPPVAKRDVPMILRAVDATVVHATATPVYRYGISFNKLFDAMAATRPILFACQTAFDPVRAIQAGMSVPPDDPEALADAMIAMADAGPAARKAMGAAGRAYVEHEHDIAVLASSLSDIVWCQPAAEG